MIDALDWQLSWGDKEQKLIALSRKRGKRFEALENKPDHDDAVDWFFNAFAILRHGIPAGGGITITALDAYATRMRLPLEFDEFVDIIMAMDRSLQRSTK